MPVDLPVLALEAVKAIEAFEEKVQLYNLSGERLYVDPAMMVQQFEYRHIGDPQWYQRPSHYRLAEYAYIKSKIYLISKESGYRNAMIWRLSYEGRP